MATGDVYTQASGIPAWAAPAGVISGNGPVLTNHTGVPSWTTASAAVSGSWDVYTVSSSSLPEWAPLSTPPSFVGWVVNHNTDTVSVFDLTGTGLGTFTHTSISSDGGIAVVGSEGWIASNVNHNIARFDLNGNALGTFNTATWTSYRERVGATG